MSPSKLILSLLAALTLSTATAQNPMGGLQIGEGIPPHVESMYRAGLAFLASTQTRQGNWPDQWGQQPGVVGFAIMAMLATGEDPNFGPYRTNIRRAAEFLITQQDVNTGYIGNSMYNHAFATLALAELYGHLREPCVGVPLKRAIELILNAQAQNPRGAWRYQPNDQDADTTVSGGQIVSLFAAKNAGLEIPVSAIDRALDYMRSNMAGDGGIGYTSPSGGNTTRSAIASLNLSLNNDLTSEEARKIFAYIRNNIDQGTNYLYYHFYYLSQALFQADMTEWRAWNARIIELFRATQQANGSWNGQRGPTFSTSTALLTMALNYRLLPIYER